MTEFSKIPFFHGLHPLEAAGHAKDCVWKNFREDEDILSIKDHSSDVCFIISGRVRLSIYNAGVYDVIIADLGPNEFFGEMAAFDRVKRSANAKALTNVELAMVPGAIFKELVLSSPEISERLIKLLSTRLRETNKCLL